MTRTNLPATETPEFLADIMASMALINPGDRVLEPSAGYGNLAFAARRRGAKVICVELNKDACGHLRYNGFITHNKDFLNLEIDSSFDAVLMCPPKNSIQHIDHAMQFLNPKGVLIALVRKDSENIEKYLDNYFELPDNMFSLNGNNVESGLVVLCRKLSLF